MYQLAMEDMQTDRANGLGGERESTTELIDRRVGPTQQISGQKGVIESFIFLLFL